MTSQDRARRIADRLALAAGRIFARDRDRQPKIYPGRSRNVISLTFTVDAEMDINEVRQGLLDLADELSVLASERPEW